MNEKDIISEILKLHYKFGKKMTHRLLGATFNVRPRRQFYQDCHELLEGIQTLTERADEESSDI